jgi:hypothetical protein
MPGSGGRRKGGDVNVRQLGRIGAALAATAATVTVLAACGGSTAKATPAANGTPGGQANIQAYISCLNKNGVTISLPTGGTGTRPSGRPTARPTGVRPSRSPGAGGGFGGGGFTGGGGFGGGAGIFGDPTTPPSGVSQSTWTAALAACKSVQPSFAAGGFGGRGGAGGGGTAFQAYRNCLTSHGVSASAAPGNLSTADPTIAAAEKACQPLLPTRGPNPSPTS